MLQISRKSIQAHVSFSDFKMCCEKEEEKYEENKTNFEGAYLGKSLADSAQIWNWGCPPQGNSHRKFRVFLVRECWATDAWKQHFLYSCKIHICLSRTLGFLGRTTHYRVSWWWFLQKQTNQYKENFINLKSIQIIVIKYKKIRLVTYFCRYSCAHLNLIIQPCHDELEIKFPIEYLQE